MRASSKYGRFSLLVLSALLLLASCGGSAATGGGMQGMDHGGENGAKKAQGETRSGAKGKERMHGMRGMDHGDMGGMASGMLMKNGKYSDERFIDAMVPHHEGAVQMARVALKNAEHPEIKQLAENIVSSQEAEIGEMRSIKKKEFGTSRVPMKMSPEQTKGMGMMMDPGKLADKKPFDKAFIDAMIPHHRSAIDMANVALEDSENPEIRKIARAIVDTQGREIERMQGWRNEWYPEG